MKNRIIGLIIITALTAGVLTGCGQSSGTVSKDENSEQTSEIEKELEPIRVGAGVTPHAEILREIQDDLEEKGYALEVVEYNDYVLPNTALEDGDLDANYFQHKPYLDDFNAENGTHIVGVANVHFEPLGIYAGKTKSLADLKDGAEVAVPNDTTNEARALV